MQNSKFNSLFLQSGMNERAKFIRNMIFGSDEDGQNRQGDGLLRPPDESHRIGEQGRMLAGRPPLTLKCIEELVESFSVEEGNTPHGRVPGNMLYADTAYDPRPCYGCQPRTAIIQRE
ncbi:MAG: hypothetical protein LBL33_08260 [Tannerella sp.]|nr:hypothetical protein [Tannerella sp.]